MLGRSRKGHGIGFEQLERRDLLAGNVTASLVDGDLVIKGDNASNSVVVTQIDSKTFEVSGRAAGGSETKINGKAVPARVTGVIDDIRAQLYSGHDEINFYGGSATAPLTVADDIVVDMDAGNDTVGFNFVKAGGDVEIYMGSGVDQFIGVGVTTGGNMFVLESGTPFYAGNSDFVNIYGGSRINGQLQVKFNRGNDSFKMNQTTVKSLWIEGGGGNDAAFIDNTTATTFIRIDPGAGSDNTTVQNTSVGDDLIVTEASDARPTADVDSVSLMNNQVKDYVWIEGNRGRDNVRIDFTVADRLFASLGAGNDSLNIKNTTIRAAVMLDGGAGSDTLNRYKTNKTFAASNFESFLNKYF